MRDAVIVAVIAVLFNVALSVRNRSPQQDVVTRLRGVRATNLILQASVAFSTVPLLAGIALVTASAVATLYTAKRGNVEDLVVIAALDVALALLAPFVPVLIDLMWAASAQPGNT